MPRWWRTSIQTMRSIPTAWPGRLKKAMTFKSALLLLSVLLAGCVTPPKESVHPDTLKSTRAGLTGAAVEPIPDGWWKSFDDPQLDGLIRAGLKDSPTLAEAQARVADALARAQVAQSKLRPSAKLDASALYQRAPQNYIIPPPLAGHTFWSSQAGASLSWDLDFFGKQANAVHRAQALTRSAALDVENSRLLLGTAIAQAYVELYRENALADIAER